MDKTTRLLIFVSSFIVFLGLFFLWSGIKPSSPAQLGPRPSSAIVAQTESQATIEPPTQSSSSGVVSGEEGQKVLVTKVVDGDTIQIESGQTVRLIGIDTPETVDPRRPVGCFGKEASNKTKELLQGKLVILEKDVSETDKYQRLLRYIYLPLDDGRLLFVNDYLVREGFAKLLTYPPDVKYNEQLLQAQQEARVNNRGLWGKC